MCSVSWAGDGSFLAIGNDQGDVELWDADTGQRVRKMSGHQVRPHFDPSAFRPS